MQCEPQWRKTAALLRINEAGVECLGGKDRDHHQRHAHGRVVHPRFQTLADALGFELFKGMLDELVALRLLLLVRLLQPLVQLIQLPRDLVLHPLAVLQQIVLILRHLVEDRIHLAE